MQRDILSAYLSRYVDPKDETLSIELARNGWLGMEQSLLDGWQNGSNQSARTQASPKSPVSSSSTSCGTERISSNRAIRCE
jgi:putative transposase